MNVSARFLLEGGWYALHQCGVLLSDAVLLHDATRYATATGVAMLAREELGKAKILFDLWKDVQVGRRAVTTKQIKSKLDDHEEKQRRAQLSMTFQAAHGTREATLMREMIELWNCLAIGRIAGCSTPSMRYLIMTESS